MTLISTPVTQIQVLSQKVAGAHSLALAGRRIRSIRGRFRAPAFSPFGIVGTITGGSPLITLLYAVTCSVH